MENDLKILQKIEEERSKKDFLKYEEFVKYLVDTNSKGIYRSSRIYKPTILSNIFGKSENLLIYEKNMEDFECNTDTYVNSLEEFLWKDKKNSPFLKVLLDKLPKNPKVYDMLKRFSNMYLEKIELKLNSAGKKLFFENDFFEEFQGYITLGDGSRFCITNPSRKNIIYSFNQTEQVKTLESLWEEIFAFAKPIF